jgi:hypothetical protein
MTSVARILGIDELGAGPCVACGAPGDTSVDLRTPEGVVEQRAASLPMARLCHSCAEDQAHASRIGSRLVYAVAAIAPVVGSVTGFVVGASTSFTGGTRHGVAVTIAVVLGLVVARVMIGVIKRARARKTRVLLLEAEGDEVVLQLSIPDASKAAVPGYRAAARAERGPDETVKPLPPRTAFGLPWLGGLIVCVPVVAAAWSGAFARTGTLVIDSPRDAVLVLIDGDAVELAEGGSATRTLGPGTHTYSVEYRARGHTVRGTFSTSFGRGTLLTTDPAQCYRIWTSSPSAKTNVHENESVRWANLDDAKLSARSDCSE